MLEGKLLCPLHITFPDSLCQFFMLLYKKISCLPFLQILHTITIDLLTHIVEHLNQSLIIGSLIDNLMKSNISLCKLYKISLCDRMLKLLGSKPQLSHLLLSHTGTGFLNGHILKSNTDFQNIIKILLCNICNLRTTPWDHHHQTLLLKLTHSFPDRSSAHTKSLSQCDLHQSLTWLQLSLKDSLTQSIKNYIS